MPAVCGLTFELTPTAEAGVVSPVRDDATAGTDRAYNACRSGSGAERGVRPQFSVGGYHLDFSLLRLYATGSKASLTRVGRTTDRGFRWLEPSVFGVSKVR